MCAGCMKRLLFIVVMAQIVLAGVAVDASPLRRIPGFESCRNAIRSVRTALAQKDLELARQELLHAMKDADSPKRSDVLKTRKRDSWIRYFEDALKANASVSLETINSRTGQFETFQLGVPDIQKALHILRSGSRDSFIPANVFGGQPSVQPPAVLIFPAGYLSSFARERIELSERFAALQSLFGTGKSPHEVIDHLSDLLKATPSQDDFLYSPDLRRFFVLSKKWNPDLWHQVKREMFRWIRQHIPTDSDLEVRAAEILEYVRDLDPVLDPKNIFSGEPENSLFADQSSTRPYKPSAILKGIMDSYRTLLRRPEITADAALISILGPAAEQISPHDLAQLKRSEASKFKSIKVELEMELVRVLRQAQGKKPQYWDELCTIFKDIETATQAPFQFRTKDKTFTVVELLNLPFESE